MRDIIVDYLEKCALAFTTGYGVGVALYQIWVKSL